MIGKLDWKGIVVVTVLMMISAGALSSVYALTRDKIERNKTEELKRALREVNPALSSYRKEELKMDDGRTFEIYYTETEKGITGAVKCFNKKGYGGKIEALIGVNEAGEVLSVKVLSDNETPGLGKKVLSPDFLKQYEKATLSNNFAVKKDGGDFNYVTSATITSRAITSLVHDALIAFKKFAERRSGR